ncbi:unnamed protein product [Pleuronectes platessa]|uniref:Uncharacterized protein n=1 Tax=Pleuronectes platessa TaxID=8262 RepID=A0A9N7V0G8_PLEPL|nr:unnamed protein product [Pleuronectes platessa]
METGPNTPVSVLMELSECVSKEAPPGQTGDPSPPAAWPGATAAVWAPDCLATIRSLLRDETEKKVTERGETEEELVELLERGEVGKKYIYQFQNVELIPITAAREQEEDKERRRRRTAEQGNVGGMDSVFGWRLRDGPACYWERHHRLKHQGLSDTPPSPRQIISSQQIGLSQERDRKLKGQEMKTWFSLSGASGDIRIRKGKENVSGLQLTVA